MRTCRRMSRSCSRSGRRCWPASYVRATGCRPSRTWSRSWPSTPTPCSRRTGSWNGRGWSRRGRGWGRSRCAARTVHHRPPSWRSGAAWPAGWSRPAPPVSTTPASRAWCDRHCCPRPTRRSHDTRRRDDRAARQAIRAAHRPHQVGTARMHPGGARGQHLRSGRRERGRQDDAAEAAGGPGPSHDRLGAGARTSARRRLGVPARRGLPGPGGTAVPTLDGGRPPRDGRAPEPGLGCGPDPAAAARSRHPARPAGGDDVGRPARAGRAGVGAGQASPGAAARRTGGGPGSLGPTGVSRHPRRRRGRGRGQPDGDPVQSPGQRPGTYLRSPRRPRRVAHPAGRRPGRCRGVASPADRSPAGSGADRTATHRAAHRADSAPDQPVGAPGRAVARPHLAQRPALARGHRAGLPRPALPNYSRAVDCDRRRAMTWLLWRQHRLQAAVSWGLMAAFAVLLWITGVHMADLYRSCRASAACSGGTLFESYKPPENLVTLTIAAPLVLGMLWAAPLIAREFETGTHTLAWAQSVSRRHWLTAKLVVLLGRTLLWSGALAALVTWWSGK